MMMMIIKTVSSWKGKMVAVAIPHNKQAIKNQVGKNSIC